MLGGLCFLVSVAGAAGAAEPVGESVIERITAQLTEQSGQAPTAEEVAAAVLFVTVRLYQDGQYAFGMEVAEQAYRYCVAELGEEHPASLTVANNLAGLYRSQGRYGEAEPLFRRALATFERVLGAEHSDTLASLNNLAVLYESQGRYGEAEPLHRCALAARERVLGAEHSDTLASLNNLALLHYSQGRYGEAEPLYRRALATCERVLGAEHPATLTSLNNLAVLYRSQGRYGEAEPLYRRALATRERVLEAEHPDILMSLNNLAGLYQSQGRYGEAEPLYRRAQATFERMLGAEHPRTLISRRNLIALYAAQRDTTRALRHLHKLEAGLQAFVARELGTTLDERIRRQFLTAQSFFQDMAFSLALQQPGLRTRALAADAMLRWKQVAREEEARAERLARTNWDPRFVELREPIAAARSRLSRAEAALACSRAAEPLDQARIEREAARKRLAELERYLRGLAEETAPGLAIQGVGYRQVQSRLPRGSALLELRHFKPVDFKTGKREELHWLALLLPADPGEGPEFRLLDLGPVAATLEDWVGARLHDPEAARALYRKLFAPLDEALADYERLYIAPDGPLALIAFARLVLPDGRYWVERQQVRQLQSGRDLLASPGTDGGQGI